MQTSTLGEVMDDADHLNNYLKKQQYFGKLGIESPAYRKPSGQNNLDFAEFSRESCLRQRHNSNTQLIMSRISVGGVNPPNH